MTDDVSDRCAHCHGPRDQRPRLGSAAWFSRISSWSPSTFNPLSTSFSWPWSSPLSPKLDPESETKPSSTGYFVEFDPRNGIRHNSHLLRPVSNPRPDQSICTADRKIFDPAQFPRLNSGNDISRANPQDRVGFDERGTESATTACSANIFRPGPCHSTVSTVSAVPSYPSTNDIGPMKMEDPLRCMSATTFVFAHRVISLISLIPITLTLLGIALFHVSPSAQLPANAASASFLTGLLLGKFPVSEGAGGDAIATATLLTLSDILAAAESVKDYVHRTITVGILMHTFVHAQRYFSDISTIERNYEPGCRRRGFRRFLFARELFMMGSWISFSALASAVAVWDLAENLTELDQEWLKSIGLGFEELTPRPPELEPAGSPGPLPPIPRLPQLPPFPGSRPSQEMRQSQPPINIMVSNFSESTGRTVAVSLLKLATPLSVNVTSNPLSMNASLVARAASAPPPASSFRPPPFSPDLVMAMLVLASLSFVSACLEFTLLKRGIDLVPDPRPERWRLGNVANPRRQDWGREWEMIRQKGGKEKGVDVGGDGDDEKCRLAGAGWHKSGAGDECHSGCCDTVCSSTCSLCAANQNNCPGCAVSLECPNSCLDCCSEYCSECTHDPPTHSHTGPVDPSASSDCTCCRGACSYFCSCPTESTHTDGAEDTDPTGPTAVPEQDLGPMFEFGVGVEMRLDPIIEVSVDSEIDQMQE